MLERFRFYGNAALSQSPWYEPTIGIEAIPFKPEPPWAISFPLETPER
jgi:hypothetical protein